MGFYPRNATENINFLAGDNGGRVQQGFIAVVEGAPSAVAAASVLALTAQPASGTTVVTTGLTDPNMPAVLTCVGNQASCTGNLVIVGTDANDQALTETLAINGTSTVTGTKAFKTITSVTIPAQGASGDQVSVGVTKKIGLNHKIVSTAHKLLTIFDGSSDAGTFTRDGTDVSKNVYTVAGTPDGTKTLQIAYLVH